MINKLTKQIKMEVFNELLETIKTNAIENKCTIDNVELFVKSWKKEAESLQLRKADVSSSDFRIFEYNGVFKIQRKQTLIKNTGCLWWKKTTETIKWKYIDKYGRFLYSINTRYISYNNYNQKTKDFKTLDKALIAVDVIKKGYTHHYC
jgi:hypothetical protein